MGAISKDPAHNPSVHVACYLLVHLILHAFIDPYAVQSYTEDYSAGPYITKDLGSFSLERWALN